MIIKINCADVKSKGNSICEDGAAFRDTASNLGTAIDAFNNSWTGQGATANIKKYKEFADNLIKTSNTISAYGQKLIEISNEFEKFENEQASEMGAM